MKTLFNSKAVFDRNHLHRAFRLIIWVLLLIPLCIVPRQRIHADEEQYPYFIKNYNIEGEGAEAPSETFQFTAVLRDIDGETPSDGQSEYVNTLHAGSTLSENGITFPLKWDTNHVLLEMPDNSDYIQPGIYHYEIKEKPGNTAGITYNPDTYIFTFRVYQDGEDYHAEKNEGQFIYSIMNERTGEKTASIDNLYKAGSLHIEKKVKGNADRDKAFPMQLTLSTAGKDMKSTIRINDKEIKPDEWENGTYTASFSLKADEGVDITNLPVGLQYTLEETDADGMDVLYTSRDGKESSEKISGVIDQPQKDSLAITNTKEFEPVTSASSGNIPYLGVFAMTLAAAILFVLKLKWQL